MKTPPLHPEQKMETAIWNSLRWLIPGLLLLLVLPSYAGAQPFSIPNSDTQIHGEIELPDGQIATFSRVEGGIVTIRDEATGAFYALIANLKDRSPGQANILTLEIRDQPEGSQSAEELDQFVLAVDESSRVPTGSGMFAVTLTGINEGRFPSLYLPDGPLELGSKEDLLGDIFQPLCCVTCNGFTVCADSVSLSCGSCGSGGFLAK